MLVRIVKLTIQTENIASFEQIFEETHRCIRNFEGCSFLELYRDKTNTNVFFTYSYWDSETDLQRYRNSAFFKEVWGQTKMLFSDKPEAWSVEKIKSLI